MHVLKTSLEDINFAILWSVETALDPYFIGVAVFSSADTLMRFCIWMSLPVHIYQNCKDVQNLSDANCLYTFGAFEIVVMTMLCSDQLCISAFIRL